MFETTREGLAHRVKFLALFQKNPMEMKNNEAEKTPLDLLMVINHGTIY